MNSDWSEIEIGSEINILAGYPFNSKFFNEEGIGMPLIRIRDLLKSRISTFYSKDYSDNYVVKKEDILVGMDGDFHIVRWKNKDALLNQRNLKLYQKRNARIDIDYFFYFAQPFLKEIHDKTAATTVKHLSTFDIIRAKALFPPLLQQTKIAKILTTLDNVIEKTEEAIAKYEAIKQGMMHDLFTRGIGEDGQLRPRYEDAPELYKPSELGWIPKEWDVDFIGNCGTFSKGSNIPKYQLAPSGEGCVLYGHLYTKYHNTIEKTESRVPSEFVKGMSPLKSGSILFAGSGETHEEIGKCAVFLMDDKVFAGGDIIILDLDNEFYKPYFGYFLNFESIQRQKARLGQGSSVIHIYPKHLSSILIAIPKKEEQELIFKKINSLDSQLKREQKTLSKQTQVKQGLMQDLLTGKVPVKADPLPLLSDHG